MALFFFMLFNEYNPNRSLDRICLDLLLPSCFLTALVRLPTSVLPFHLAVARYAFDETSAHLLNNRTKSGKECLMTDSGITMARSYVFIDIDRL